jgi:hypothetical protein
MLWQGARGDAVLHVLCVGTVLFRQGTAALFGTVEASRQLGSQGLLTLLHILC